MTKVFEVNKTIRNEKHTHTHSYTYTHTDTHVEKQIEK